ncbi:MAG: valine--tRNA ligase [Phycisphaerales bacterium]
MSDATTTDPRAASGATNQLPKAYTPAQAEQVAWSRWNDARCFHAEPADPGAPYCIFIPPPNVTAALHLGHALNNTLQDVLTRYHRMRGMDALWMPGTDHAGIATQTVVEKRLLQQGKRRTDFARADFVAKVQEWKDEYEATILAQLQAMGCSCDYERVRFTMDPVCAAAVREAFFRLFCDGLIYRGKRLVNWDPVSRTALADDEVEMEEVDGHFWYLRYPLADGSGHVTVATTRPETMLGDTAVGVNPRDPRAAALRGKKVRLPIVDRVIPIVEDDYVVMPPEQGGDPADPKAAFATGFLKVTPAHDPNDWEIGIRHGLAAINVMAPDASISDRHGWEDVTPAARAFVGLSREEARAAIVKWFAEHGLLESTRPYRHGVGHSYRSHVPVEPYLSEQWYVRVTDDRLRGSALRAMDPAQRTGAAPAAQHSAGPQAAAADGSLTFFPARYARTFQLWHENIRDWCISRQLWWGHRIPVWSREVPAAEIPAPQRAAADAARGELVRAEGTWSAMGCAESVRVRPDGAYERFVCVPEKLDATAVPALEAAGFRQDEDVLDTWFSSALWPLSTLGWPDPARFGMQGLLDRYNPSAVLSTAREIITLWVSRMVMFNRYFLGGRLPFRHVFIHAMVQDGFGQKMSKSLANGVDPRDIIHTHGGDAMRFTLVQMATDTQDVRLPVDVLDPHSGQIFAPRTITDAAGYTVAAPIQESPADPSKKMVTAYGAATGAAVPTPEMPLARNISARFDVGRNFANKVWNATRFALGNLGESAAATPTDLPMKDRPLCDRWIIARLGEAVAAYDRAIAGYRFSEAGEAMYDFVWREFCDWYLEAIKPTVRTDPAQQQVLRTVLDASLRLLHPAMPFITEQLWPAVQATGAAGVAGVSLPGSPLCATAAWPRIAPAAADTAAQETFARVQTLVESIRTLRGERQVPPKRRITLLAPEPVRALAAQAGGVIEALAGLDRVDGLPNARPAGAVALAFEGHELLLVNLVDAVDAGAERARLEKVIADRTRAAAGFEAKLGNAGYLAKAKPELVEETRRMLAEAKADIEAARRAVDALR